MFKRLLTAVATLALSCQLLAATLNPVQLLNPAGSTSGQAILSTGASSAPAWGTVSATALTGILPIVNGGTGQTTASAALSALGGAPLASPTFTGTVTIPGGTINNATVGATTPNTGAFTTLSASSTVSGTGFSTYLASPPAIGGTAAAAGKFTTLQATSAITPSSTSGIVGTTTNDSANAGSIGELISPAATIGTSMTSGTAMNAASASLTAGDWDVQCQVQTVPAGSTTTTYVDVGISTTSATFQTISGSFLNFNAGPSAAAGVQVNTSSPVTRVSVASTTTTYCVAQSGFAVSTMAIDGLIRARRVR